MNRFFTPPRTSPEQSVVETRIIAEGSIFPPSKHRESRARLIDEYVEKVCHSKIEDNLPVATAISPLRPV